MVYRDTLVWVVDLVGRVTIRIRGVPKVEGGAETSPYSFAEKGNLARPDEVHHKSPALRNVMVSLLPRLSFEAGDKSVHLTTTQLGQQETYLSTSESDDIWQFSNNTTVLSS